MYEVNIAELKKRMIDANLERVINLSARSGVDRNTLSKILNAEIKPSTSVIEKLMMALAISPDDAGKIFFAADLRNP